MRTLLSITFYVMLLFPRMSYGAGFESSSIQPFNSGPTIPYDALNRLADLEAQKYNENIEKLASIIESRNNIVLSTPKDKQDILLQDLSPVDAEINNLTDLVKYNPSQFPYASNRLLLLRIQLIKISYNYK